MRKLVGFDTNWRKSYWMAAALGFAAACSHHVTPETGLPTCPGDVLATVTNESADIVEVLATIRLIAAPRLLGTVPVGQRQEFVLPERTVAAYTRPVLAPGEPVRTSGPNGTVAVIRYGCKR